MVSLWASVVCDSVQLVGVVIPRTGAVLCGKDMFLIDVVIFTVNPTFSTSRVQCVEVLISLGLSRSARVLTLYAPRNVPFLSLLTSLALPKGHIHKDTKFLVSEHILNEMGVGVGWKGGGGVMFHL